MYHLSYSIMRYPVIPTHTSSNRPGISFCIAGFICVCLLNVTQGAGQALNGWECLGTVPDDCGNDIKLT